MGGTSYNTYVPTTRHDNMNIQRSTIMCQTHISPIITIIIIIVYSNTTYRININGRGLYSIKKAHNVHITIIGTT